MGYWSIFWYVGSSTLALWGGLGVAKDMIMHFVPSVTESSLFTGNMIISVVFLFAGLISLYVGKRLGLLKGTNDNKSYRTTLESINLKLDKISDTFVSLNKRVSDLEAKGNKDGEV